MEKKIKKTEKKEGTVKIGKKRVFRSFIGTVVKAAMRKTIVVRIDTMKEHRKYDRYFRVSKKYHVHDEKGLAKVGDKVKFTECRPLSKTKKWFLVEVVK